MTGSNREIYYSTSAANTSSTSSTYATKSTLTFTPLVGSQIYWLLFCGIGFHATSTTVQGQWKFQNDTDSVIYNEPIRPGFSTNSWLSLHGMGKYTSPGSPVAVTLSAQLKDLGNGAGGSSAGLASTNMIAIIADPADKYAESLTPQTTTSGSNVSALNLTFTPASTGDYLFYFSAELSNDTVFAITNPGHVKLTIDGTDYNSCQFGVDNTTDVITWGGVLKLTLTNASHVIDVNYFASNSSTATIQNVRILALRLDTVKDTQYAESRAGSSTTSTSLQQALTTGSVNMHRAKYLAMYGIQTVNQDVTTTDLLSHFDVQNIGTFTQTYLDAQFGQRESTNKWEFVWFEQHTFQAIPYTFKWQYRSGVAGQTTIYRDAAIAMVQLSDAGIKEHTLTSQGVGG